MVNSHIPTDLARIGGQRIGRSESQRAREDRDLMDALRARKPGYSSWNYLLRELEEYGKELRIRYGER